MVIRRFDVYLIDLEPTVGSELRKTPPCLVISPDDMNRYLNTVLIAPMTTQGKAYPSRVPCYFDGKSGHIALDQLRVIDKSRLVKRLGRIDITSQRSVLDVLARLFAE